MATKVIGKTPLAIIPCYGGLTPTAATTTFNVCVIGGGMSAHCTERQLERSSRQCTREFVSQLDALRMSRHNYFTGVDVELIRSVCRLLYRVGQKWHKIFICQQLHQILTDFQHFLLVKSAENL